MAIQRTSVSDP